MENSSIGKKVRYWREKKNMTQAYLAEMSGVSERTVQRIETGKSNGKSSLVDICKALNLNPNFIKSDLNDLTRQKKPHVNRNYKMNNPFEYLYKWIQFQRDENHSFEEILKSFETCSATRMDPNDPEQYELAKIIIKHALGEIPDSEIAPHCSPIAVTDLKPIKKFSEGYLFEAITEDSEDCFFVWVDENISTTFSSIEEINTLLQKDLAQVLEIIKMKAHTCHPHELPDSAKSNEYNGMALVKLTWRDLKPF